MLETRDVQLQSAPALCVISLMQQGLGQYYVVCALSNTFTVPTFMLLQGRQQAGHAGGGGAAQPRHPGHAGDGLGDRQGLATPGLSVSMSSDSCSSMKIDRYSHYSEKEPCSHALLEVTNILFSTCINYIIALCSCVVVTSLLC